ncbi:hypothetical protein [Gayadomonas joobiniege]|uniref:hypothetical protein n=1 Tax=Gayadomonas joobiniege TaxID=1234606 RepID=UPI00035D53ED|nr:hypothetical protein [Gayadomonas joobiniege]
MKKVLTAVFTLAVVLSSSANAALYVGGYRTGGEADTQLIKSLNALGETYTQVTATTFPTTLNSGDIVVWGQDGMPSGWTLPDITSWLNNGVDIILTGGANTDPWRDWVDNYFNITDTSVGFHADFSGEWTSLGDSFVTAYLPDTYTMQRAFAYAFHMLGFLPTPDTLLYAVNGETPQVHIGALRSYDNDGSFNYLSYRWGRDRFDPQDEVFMTNWLKGSLEQARFVSEPLPLTIFALALTLLAVSRRRVS